MEDCGLRMNRITDYLYRLRIARYSSIIAMVVIAFTLMFDVVEFILAAPFISGVASAVVTVLVTNKTLRIASALATVVCVLMTYTACCVILQGDWIDQPADRRAGPINIYNAITFFLSLFWLCRLHILTVKYQNRQIEKFINE